MHTPTHNAAHPAVQAEPCLHAPGTDTSRCTCALGAHVSTLQTAALLAAAELVLQAEDDTEGLRTVVRAYRAVQAMVGYTDHPHALVTGDDLAALLGTLNDAMSARLTAMGTKVDTVRAAVRRTPMDGQAVRLAADASDQAESLGTVRDAYGAVQHLAPYAEHASGAGLSAALQLLNDAMCERLATMDEQLDALHAALRGKAGAA
ncbi:hypothetical protein [Pseudorhodoferax sp.]|uniref:hypothetical protein n=1 Tax=Pseudorhodoferax sp. TaxID=1993553 RepID=UPI002DD669E2|nr:hypothetical protein [Pseudorhodoferax sp.]